MNEITLKYGCNPNQAPAKIYMRDGSDLPLKQLNGRAGYINFLDALNAWQLVKNLKKSLKLPAAASFKHVSPAGAALGIELSETEKKMFFVEQIENINDSKIACAYVRARGADRLCSFGDYIALSDRCDEICARAIEKEVSDGIIAPSYSEKALEILSKKRNGSYSVIQIDENYEPGLEETRDVFGISLSQRYNDSVIDESLLENVVTQRKDLSCEAKRDLLLAMICLKYTQSNSVCLAKNGQVIGNGAGQQSRVHCTRLASDKADIWHLRQHPKTLSLPFKKDIKRAQRDNAIDCFVSKRAKEALNDIEFTSLFETLPELITEEERSKWLLSQRGVSLASDAFFPFDDNITRAHESGVEFIVQPGGSVRDEEVIRACDKYNIAMAFSGLRLFHH